MGDVRPSRLWETLEWRGPSIVPRAHVGTTLSFRGAERMEQEGYSCAPEKVFVRLTQLELLLARLRIDSLGVAPVDRRPDQ